MLLVDDTSRISRRQADQANFFDQLRFAGIRFFAVSQGIDSANEQAEVIMTVHGCGTNKRVRRERPHNEWKVVERPELRVVSAELWERVQVAMRH